MDMLTTPSPSPAGGTMSHINSSQVLHAFMPLLVIGALIVIGLLAAVVSWMRNETRHHRTQWGMGHDPVKVDGKWY